MLYFLTQTFINADDNFLLQCYGMTFTSWIYKISWSPTPIRDASFEHLLCSQPQMFLFHALRGREGWSVMIPHGVCDTTWETPLFNYSEFYSENSSSGHGDNIELHLLAKHAHLLWKIYSSSHHTVCDSYPNYLLILYLPIYLCEYLF